MSVTLSTITFVLCFIAGALSDATITSWTKTSLTPAPWNYHRCFLTTFDGDKVYCVGQANNPMILDLSTEAWTTSSIGGAYINGDDEGQYGAAINDKFYFIDKNEPTKIGVFDAVDGSMNRFFATNPTPGNEECVTSNGVDTIYIIYGHDFYKLDVMASTPTAEKGGSLGHIASRAQCVYNEGYVYVFGGGSDKISKIQVDGVFADSVWEDLSVVMPDGGVSKGSTVVGPNGLIYVGCFHSSSWQIKMKIYSFDPKNQADGLIAEPDFTQQRAFCSLVAYNNRVYSVLGSDSNSKRDIEYTNELDPCLLKDCDDDDECTTDSCDSAIGECVNTAITCDDGNVCTIDTCDSAIGCVYNEKCDSSLDLLCFTGDCEADCSAFAMDRFLLDCSTEYDVIEARLTAMDGVDGRLDNVENDISIIFGKLTGIADAINSAHSVESFGNILNDGISKSTIDKDSLIIFLLISNMLLIVGGIIACILCTKTANKKHSKYEKVNVYSSNDEHQKLQN